MNTETLLPVFGELFAKGFAILLLAMLIVRICHRASAAYRHFIWLAALVVLLILPATRLVTPFWKISFEKPVQVTVPAAKLPTVAMTAWPVVGETAGMDLPATTRKLPEWRMLVIATWLVGLAGVLAYRILGSWRLRSLEKSSAPVEDVRILEMAQGILCDLRIGRAIAIRVSSICRVPITWGAWRPVLMLPVEALDWDDTRLKTALRHEAGHICRHDYLVRWVAQVACAVYWPNPLVWLAARWTSAATKQEPR